MSQRVIITGASSGIGSALAWQYAERGYDVGLCARREENLQETCQSLSQRFPQQRFMYELIDVTDTDNVAPALEALTKRMGSVDIVIVNAGITDVRRTGSGDISKDIRVLQTNLIGAIATIDAAIAIFRKQDYGHLVGISSFSAFRGIPGSAAYSASKAALTNYLEAVRTELYRKKIKITTIHPGFIKTGLADDMENFPFVIDADTAAVKMAMKIQKGVKEATIPSWPWTPLRYIMKVMPDHLVAKMF